MMFNDGNMSEKDKNQDMQRRKVIKSLGAASGAMATGALAFPGSAAAKDKKKKGRIDTSDWDVDIDVSGDQVKDKEIYVGKNKNTELDSNSIATRAKTDNSGDLTTQGWSVSSSATLLTWNIPYDVPYIGGDTVTLEASVSVSLTGASISLDICLNGSSCISVAGVNVQLGNGEIGADIKGSFYGVPFTLDGSVGYDISVDPFGPSASVSLTPSAQLCLGRDLCDKNASGWQNVACQLCASASHSITLI